jgi:hypothetical protein
MWNCHRLTRSDPGDGVFQAVWLSWINALIGAWLFVAAFTIDQSGAAGWNDAVVGVLVFLLAIGSAAATERLVRLRRLPRGRRS